MSAPTVLPATSDVLAAGLPSGSGFALGMLAALAASLLLTPVMARVARLLGAVDRPSARRVHYGITPRLGGLAVYVAFWLGLAVAHLSGTSAAGEPGLLPGFAIGLLMLVGIGLYDDTKDAPPWIRFVFQSMAAHVAWHWGFRFTLLGDLLGPFPFQDGIEWALTVLWIVGVTNAMNFIDGLDFLCAGTGLAAVAGLAGVAIASGHTEFLVHYLVLAAALVGFGHYNRNPASIFLGDSGSTFLGYFVACFAAHQGARGGAATGACWVPVVLLAVPVGDTLYAIGRRLWMGVSPLKGDRGHLHHRLLSLGRTQGQVVRTVAGTTLLLAFAATAVAVVSRTAALGIVSVVVVALLVSARRLGLFDPEVIRAGRCNAGLPPPAAPESRTMRPADEPGPVESRGA